MNIWRIAGVALVAGLALFLVSLLVKLVLITGVAFLLVRVVGGWLASRTSGYLGRGSWPEVGIISIDNPAFRSLINRAGFERIVPIS